LLNVFYKTVYKETTFTKKNPKSESENALVLVRERESQQPGDISVRKRYKKNLKNWDMRKKKKQTTSATEIKNVR